MNKVESITIFDLPDETLVSIFDKLPSAEDRGRSRRVCKLFKRVLGDASFEPYWKGQFQEKFRAYVVQMNEYSPWQRGFREFANAEKKCSAELSDEVKRAIETVKRSHDQWINNTKEASEAFSILRRYEDGGGNAQIHYNLALCYAFQIGVGDLAEEKRMKCARINYKKAADLGHAISSWRIALGYILAEESNDNEALRYLRLGVELGLRESIAILNICFIKRNMDKSVECPADTGFSPLQLVAMNNFLVRVVESKAFTDEEGFSCMKVLADQGNSFYYFLVGSYYLRGDVVEANNEEAVRYFKLAAAKGNELATNVLSMIGKR